MVCDSIRWAKSSDILAQEEEAEKLMAESFAKNFIDYEEYPQSAEIQNRCVSMIARLFNARPCNRTYNPSDMFDNWF
jgi:glutamate/tyrosine decarboxylase-like PLP-dependent enzyme